MVCLDMVSFAPWNASVKPEEIQQISIKSKYYKREYSSNFYV